MHCSLWYDGLPVNEPMSAASWETSQWLGKLLCEVYLRIKRTCNICMVVYLSKWNTNEDFLFKVLKRNRRVAYQGQALDLLASPLPSNLWHQAFSVLILFSQSDGHPHPIILHPKTHIYILCDPILCIPNLILGANQLETLVTATKEDSQCQPAAKSCNSDLLRPPISPFSTSG